MTRQCPAARSTANDDDVIFCAHGSLRVISLKSKSETNQKTQIQNPRQALRQDIKLSRIKIPIRMSKSENSNPNPQRSTPKSKSETKRVFNHCGFDSAQLPAKSAIPRPLRVRHSRMLLSGIQARPELDPRPIRRRSGSW